MRLALVAVMVLHGLLHFLGFAQAFRLASFEGLKLPISQPAGVLWLVAGLAFLGAALALSLWPRWWWAPALAAVVVSQGLVLAFWSDALMGTVPNLVTAVAAVVGLLAWGPWSDRAEYARRVERNLARPAPSVVLRREDLAALPPIVARYVERSGAVGQPRVHSFKVEMEGRIRSAATAPWMPLHAEQYNFVDSAARLFWMEATRGGVPALGLHAYDEGQARMKVKVAGVAPVVDAGGKEFTRTETVTLLNDLCVMAPGALVDPRLSFRQVDPLRVEVTFRANGHTVTATLVFNEDADLVDFLSDDRPGLAPDNQSFLPMRWSTPLSDYRDYHGHRLPRLGEAHYHPPEGEYAYAEFVLTDVQYNPTAPPAP